MSTFEHITRTLIIGGESYYVEFKSAYTFTEEGRSLRELKDIANQIAEEVVAFANSDGGDLIVGVEDTGAVTGIGYEGDRLHFLSQAPATRIKAEAPVSVTTHVVSIDGYEVLLFRVSPLIGDVAVTTQGRCLWRRGSSTEPVSPKTIEAKRTERRGTTYESEPVPDATIDDLDLEELRVPWLRRRLELSQEDFLHYFNLVHARNGTLVLRRAALLLFAKDPLRWHANNRIRIRRQAGEDAGFGAGLRTRERTINGPIVECVQVATAMLRAQFEVESRGGELFAVTNLLPSEAVDECVVNALVHRNYAIEGQAIEVLILPDRVEFRSPGKLLEPLTIEALRKQTGAHRTRNPLIMRVMRELGYARDQGEGMRRIFGSMRQVELHEPELELEHDTFIVRLSTRSVYDEATQGWLSAYGPYGLKPDERKYLITLKANSGRMSVDRIARSLGKSYDVAKTALVSLESKGIVWHPHGSRSYILVEPLLVPLERYHRRFLKAGIQIAKGTQMSRARLQDVVGSTDHRTVSDAIQRLKDAGVLVPIRGKRFRFGDGFLKYAAERRKLS